MRRRRRQVAFDLPVRAVTPGQALVFYDGEVCLGSAPVRAPGRTLHERGLALPAAVAARAAAAARAPAREEPGGGTPGAAQPPPGHAQRGPLREAAVREQWAASDAAGGGAARRFGEAAC